MEFTDAPPVIVLCVDDNMRRFFELWCKAFAITESKLRVFVLPFSESLKHISEISKAFNHTLLPTNISSPWRDFGEKIYGTESYRPGLPRYTYFSKLAALSSFDSEVIFFDANAIPFCRPEEIVNEFRSSRKDILFRWQLSSLGQNIPSWEVYSGLNQINPLVGRGWSANFFITRPKVLEIHNAEKMLANEPNLRCKLGTAPEQSFLTYYIAKNNLNVGTISSFVKNIRGVSCRSSIWLNEVNGKMVLFSDDGCGADVRAFFVKWNGSALTRSMENYWISDYVNRSWEVLFGLP
jgi:hypothetical protein